MAVTWLVAWATIGCAARSIPSIPLSEAEEVILQQIEGARFIGIGESMHGSGGLAEARNALTQVLVERADVRAIAVEAPWFQAERAQAWLERCAGAPGPAARGFSHPAFVDVASAEMLAWLCAHNQRHPDAPVQVFGFDNQEPWGVEPLASLAGVEADAIHAACPMRSGVDVEACDRLLDSLSVEGRWAEAVRGGLRAWIHHLAGDEHSIQLRDDAMAELFLARAEAIAGEGRIVLWAHNVHLAATPELDRFPEVPGRPFRRWPVSGMGATLREAVGGAYRVIAIAAPSFELWRRDGRSVRWGAHRRSLERRVDPLPALVLPEAGARGIVGDMRARLDEAFDAVVVIEGGRALLALSDVHRLEAGGAITWRSEAPDAAAVVARALHAEGWAPEAPADPTGIWTRDGARVVLSVAADERWSVVTVQPAGG